MLPPGHAAGALTKDAALELVDELRRLHRLTARYRDAIGRLRRLLERIEDDQ